MLIQSKLIQVLEMMTKCSQPRKIVFLCKAKQEPKFKTNKKRGIYKLSWNLGPTKWGEGVTSFLAISVGEGVDSQGGNSSCLDNIKLEIGMGFWEASRV